ncbi:PRPK-like protein [Mya arenaria]|uniref:non-specific serine/threonine protein kinase n=2 Tax=Mya arenaria TaxID=6604 RepID=A0ABY7EU98_MYAAR|nr:PRPK-like protein [Mya arenaria]
MAAPMDTENEMEREFLKQGAEAKVYRENFYGRPCISKQRFSKAYRHQILDKSLTLQRLKSEIRAMNKCRNLVRDYIVDLQKNDPELAIKKLTPLAGKLGSILGKMHSGKIIHGDLTTSNMLLRGDPENLDIVMIDFGLSFAEGLPEDKGVDLYVFERALLSTHPNTEDLFTEVMEAYKKANVKEANDVISKLDEVRMRGRKRTMVG